MQRPTAQTSGLRTEVMSVLDCKLMKEHQTAATPDLTRAEIVELAKDAISSTGERDIYTGLCVQCALQG